MKNKPKILKSGMTKHDVIRVMGRFPDKIYLAGDSEEKHLMMSKKWICSQCDKVYEFDVETKIPAPCANCGGIGFSRTILPDLLLRKEE